jgi:SH3-like domain-containing protein
MKLRRFVRVAMGGFSIAAWIAACAPVTPSPDEVETVVAVTFAAMTASAPTNTPAAPVVTAVATTNTGIPAETFVPRIVRTSAQNVNLRLGPGALFKVSRVMAQGTPLEINGRSRGGEWLYVKNDEGIFGWVGANLVEGGLDGPPAPFVEPGDVYLVAGLVKTELGTPVSGIGFAITQGSSRRTDAKTDEDGRFYAYLPTTLTGAWVVDYVSVSCTSNTMDANCNCINGICGGAFPRSVEVTLPAAGELNFVWK